ncbi:DUF1902 domain-containing protein [Methylobacterium aerolatum]|uniref:RNase H-like HicB family nuclease n=1 Tax=Methylobacterium aerolatum TaxID=418708 RepID=A0ABU0HXU0_9HYPH|nr:DUF1902 domain-containing protein [Methylobacterium aerolatum]MDQ0446515.1 putative RNase H-like HicB family nuclease [Methylobacterium aerolatum]GJD33323.1 hypothetical protein FMGBMHLM_0210 [Methylobacterium aerolatum]
MSFTVKVSHDQEAGVWFVHESDIPGLHAEAATLDDLIAVIEDVTPDLVGAPESSAGDAAGIPVCIQHIALAKRARAA